MPIRGSIDYIDSPRIAMGRMLECAKAGMEKAAKFWHRRFMPQHFTVAGGKKYGYQPRSGDNEPPRLTKQKQLSNGQIVPSNYANPHYSWRKRRQMRHNKPLVWSGRSELLAKSAVKISSKKSRDGQLQASAAMPALPKYFYQYLKAGVNGMKHDQPKKYEELVRTTPDEVNILTEVAHREAVRLYNAGAVKREHVQA